MTVVSCSATIIYQRHIVQPLTQVTQLATEAAVSFALSAVCVDVRRAPQLVLHQQLLLLLLIYY